MIWHNDFVWLHLPRAGGTATANWVREIFQRNNSHAGSALARVSVDDDLLRQKHDNLLTREIRFGEISGCRSVVMNFRRLDEWLLSNFKFAKAAGMNVSLERYLAGEYFSLRLGNWCLADWWLHYFEMERVSHYFRLDRLEEDWRQFLQDTVGLEIPACHNIVKMNQAPECAECWPALHEGCWRVAYEKNPAWTKLEQQIFS